MPHPRREGAELLVVIRRPNTGPADSPAPRKKCSSRAESADIQNRLGVAAPRCVGSESPTVPARNGSSVSSYWVTFFAFTHAVRGSDRRGSRRPRPSIRQMAGEASRTRRAVVGGEDDAATASTTTPAPASPIAVAGDTSPRVPGTAPGTLAGGPVELMRPPRALPSENSNGASVSQSRPPLGHNLAQLLG